MKLSALVQRVNDYVLNPEYRDDAVGLRCCQLALKALQCGNYGVAAVLSDASGNVLVEAHNQVFSEQFCSAGHAEMRIIDAYEADFRNQYPADQLKLLVSLEPCPMCLSRLLLSGVGLIKYMVDDPAGGMVSRISDMPPAWQNLASMQTFYHAHISNELRQLAFDLSQHELDHLRAKLMSQRSLRTKTGH
ncbi:nucleoside deaminase [Neptunomonas sp.]|uniref:nucleoside deaminase n=1 Tax=Neptunomonas sp. TaxID=1971898 RepID=UPI00356157B9